MILKYRNGPTGPVIDCHILNFTALSVVGVLPIQPSSSILVQFNM